MSSRAHKQKMLEQQKRKEDCKFHRQEIARLENKIAILSEKESDNIVVVLFQLPALKEDLAQERRLLQAKLERVK